MRKLLNTQTALAAGVLIVANFALAGSASAHCDGVDGPVIVEARAALARQDVTPLLKWVPAAGERPVKDAFAQALAAKSRGAAAQEAGEHALFETLVRVHRESEGAPYTGIKPAGQIAPIVVAADAALEKKNADRLARHVAAQVEQAVRDKFEKAAHSQQAAGQSVDKGREFVANYVQYVHFVEELSALAAKPAGHHAAAAPNKSAHQH